jgi:hypothetical protein
MEDSPVLFALQGFLYVCGKWAWIFVQPLNAPHLWMPLCYEKDLLVKKHEGIMQNTRKALRKKNQRGS